MLQLKLIHVSKWGYRRLKGSVGMEALAAISVYKRNLIVAITVPAMGVYCQKATDKGESTVWRSVLLIVKLYILPYI